MVAVISLASILLQSKGVEVIELGREGLRVEVRSFRLVALLGLGVGCYSPCTPYLSRILGELKVNTWEKNVEHLGEKR